MPQIKFYLNNHKVEQTTIYAIVHKHNQRYKFPTGINVEPKYWNQDKCRCRERADYPVSSYINQQLEAWEDLIESVINEFGRLLIIPSQSSFREAVKGKINELAHKEVPKQMSLLEFAKWFKGEVSRKERTIARYITTIGYLEEFQKVKRKTLHFEDIDMVFYESFKKWMYQVKKLSVNTFGDTIKNIKMFMNASGPEGAKLHSCTGHKSKKFKTVSEEADTIALSVEKLIRIHRTVVDNETVEALNKQLKAKGVKTDTLPHKIELRVQAINDARDRFLIGAFSALRYQDYNTLNGITSESRFIRKRNKKTGKMTSIPMHWVIREILVKRNNRLPASISNSKMNKSLHLLCMMAGLDEPREVSITKGGERIFRSAPEFELVSSHTARRSACTNLYKAGVDPRIIMVFSGHSTIAMLMRYIRIDDEEVAEQMIEHPFFNQ